MISIHRLQRVFGIHKQMGSSQIYAQRIKDKAKIDAKLVHIFSDL